MNMERPDISLDICSLLQHYQPTTALVERSLSMKLKLLAEDRMETVSQDRKFKTVPDFAFQFFHLVIVELAAYIKRMYCKFC